MQSCGTRSRTKAIDCDKRTLTFLFLHVVHPNLDFRNLTSPAFGDGVCPYCRPMILATLAADRIRVGKAGFVISFPLANADVDGISSILRDSREPVG